MLSVALSGLVLVCNYFWRDIFLPSSCLPASLFLPKCVVAALLMVEELFILFYCENGINQYSEQKTLKDVFGASLLLIACA